MNLNKFVLFIKMGFLVMLNVTIVNVLDELFTPGVLRHIWGNGSIRPWDL
jgi:hypothetical protein